MSDRSMAPDGSIRQPTPGRMADLAASVWPPGVVGQGADGLRAYMLVDAARNPEIHGMLVRHQDAVPIRCLYQGELAEQLADVSPYIVALERGAVLVDWLLREGWGDGWGVIVHSPLDLDDARRHFRRFTVVNTEDGRTLLFRFYDPRVLRVFLPTCDRGQLDQLFRGVVRYMTEDEGGAVLRRFEWHDGQLHQLPQPLRE